jgi:hypothetical protein
MDRQNWSGNDRRVQDRIGEAEEERTGPDARGIERHGNAEHDRRGWDAMRL